MRQSRVLLTGETRRDDDFKGSAPRGRAIGYGSLRRSTGKIAGHAILTRLERRQRFKCEA